MRKLRISPDLFIPEDVITSTSVIYGGKGMGKTNLGSVLVEELQKAGLRWSVLDPMGVWWGLRHSKDGKGPGIECVILGGPHGDIPIEPTGGEIVADLVVDESANTIIDFSRKTSGEMWSMREKVRFVTDYALRLFRRQGELVAGRRREPILQLLDEAARYIPQMIPSGAIDLAKCVGAWEQIGEEGRNIGLGVGFLTQRSARMNKSVSELADVMFAFRTIGPNSLAAVMDWLGEHIEKSRIREVAAQVRELDVGQALVVSPGWLRVEKVVKVRERETFDSSATPKPGQRAQKVTGAAAKPDLAKYQERMVATIEKAKATDPKLLQQEVSRLKKELEKRNAGVVHAMHPQKVDPAVLQEKVDRAVARAVTDVHKKVVGDATQLRRILTRISSTFREIPELLDSAIAHLDTRLIENGNAIAIKEMVTTIDRPIAAARPSPVPPRAAAPARSAPAATYSGEGVVRGEQRILDALAQLKAFGVSPATRAAAGIMAGYDLTGGTGSKHIAKMVADGLVAINQPGTIELTTAGAKLAAQPADSSSLEDLHQTALSRLSEGEARILKYLLSIHPDSQTRADVGAAVGYDLTSGTGSRHIAKLNTIGFVDIPRPGQISAGALLFPEALV